MLTSTKSLENHETDQERCILPRKVYLKAIGKGFHTKPSPTLGSLPAGLNQFVVDASVEATSDNIGCSFTKKSFIC